jgi:hypothetical protein
VFDAEYFRTLLQADVDAMGGTALVTVHLMGGRTHRLRGIDAVHAGYFAAEAYQQRADGPAREPRWHESTAAGGPPLPTERAVISYESVVDVTITAARADSGAGIGFGRA